MWPFLLTFGVALAGAAILTPFARKLSWHLGFLDQPAARKVHVKATPLLGGAALGAGMLLGVVGALFPRAMGGSTSPHSGLGTVLGLVCALALGLWDDRRGLGPIPKLFGQTLTAACFLSDGLSAPLTGIPVLNALLTVFWVVGLMNAVNFLDNMDGIASGIGVVAGLAFAVLGAWRGQPVEMILGAALAGGCAGFLFFNFSPASIFLGDAGSLLVGSALARLSLGASRNAEGSALGALVALIALAYPVFDITFVTWTRLSEGRKIYQGGRDHTSHRLDLLLRDHRLTALTIYGICALLAAVALGVFRAASVGLGLAALAGVAAGFAALGMGLARVRH